MKERLIKVTTNVFTATVLPILSSAGITAAAGTRLALNLLLETRSKSLPFQSTNKNQLLIRIVTFSGIAYSKSFRSCCQP